jgi:hypothetical protein
MRSLFKKRRPGGDQIVGAGRLSNSIRPGEDRGLRHSPGVGHEATLGGTSRPLPARSGRSPLTGLLEPAVVAAVLGVLLAWRPRHDGLDCPCRGLVGHVGEVRLMRRRKFRGRRRRL